jgi:uncharacterized cupin superfamily protein
MCWAARACCGRTARPTRSAPATASCTDPNAACTPSVRALGGWTCWFSASAVTRPSRRSRALASRGPFPRWLELADGDSPYAREAQCGPPDCPPPSAQRPRNLVALSDVESILGGRARRVGHAAGAVASGLNHVVLAPRGQGAPAHCHSEEEEIFVVLGGSGVLELWGRGEEHPEEHVLGAGDVISRPPGTGVAHTLRPGSDGITYLAYGTRETSDMCFYPQSGRVSLRGLGIALLSPEIEHLPNL